jgi:kynurenine formamidase
MGATDDEADQLLASVQTWGQWGDADELGTLNHIDAAVRRDAAELVRDGTVISCAWDVTEADRTMNRAGDELDPARSDPTGTRWRVATERVTLQFHGRTMTHLDAPAHIFWDGLGYNAVPASAVSAAEGATRLAVTACAQGVVTRGVLLDLPRLLGVEHLEPGRRVVPAELQAAARAQGVEVRRGDALLVRVGQGAIRVAGGIEAATAGGRPGCDGVCLPWFKDCRISILVGDGTNDVEPLDGSALPIPIHVGGLRSMGLWLVDNANLEDLAAACSRLGRWEFLFTLAPLRLVGATGSPVNPLAIL